MTIRATVLMLLLLLTVKAAFANEKTWVILNNAYKGTVSLDVRSGIPCLTHPLLEEWGVKSLVLDRLSWDARGCLTPQAATQFSLQFWYRPDASLLTLLFPEEAFNPQQNGVSTSRWDDGINALFVNYRLDVDNKRAQYSWDTPGTDATLVLENGLNLGPWRLRYQNTFWREADKQHGSYSNSTSLWRSITSLRSRLNVGDGYTSSNLFDTISYRGVSLASNEAMFPDSWRPYSPQINGYAHSEAEVTIHQNGARVYRIHVPPGPFIIRDFYPPDSQGNLELTIQESDGTERTRSLPYSIMPNLAQHGMFSYELAAGRYKPARGVTMDKDRFWQSSLSWGVAPHTTLFGGVQQGEHYLSHVVGIGGNLGNWGAVSADVRTARYTQKDETSGGSVGRLRYAKAFFRTETSLNAQLQWYPSGSQYRSFEERLERGAMLAWGWDDDTTQRTLESQIELTQNFSEDSNLSLSWRWLKSRSREAASNSVTLSFSAIWKEVDISLYGGYDRYADYAPESTLGINISIPFTLGSHFSNVALVSDLASREHNSAGLNVYGSALDDYSLRYDVTAQHTEHGDDALKTSFGYQYNSGELNLSMNRSGAQRDYHTDLSGSILLHEEGVVLGQTLGSTVALVQVPDTPDIGFYNQFGSTTNANGDLLVSYLTPWRVNRITVDSLSLPRDKAIEVNELETVPTDGAIVNLRFLKPQKTVLPP
ncbi:fimbria/pilus outer membrane usher protein [Erwinia sp. P6884]|uniref:fimbria/pilus outer membrane usher protein n=1 Tax=Erwinia sp. P6884 TaxID=3141450 RepID=UPI0031916FFC